MLKIDPPVDIWLPYSYWNVIPCKLSTELNKTKLVSNIELWIRDFVIAKRIKFGYHIAWFFSTLVLRLRVICTC